jgi:hypothetical protein
VFETSEALVADGPFADQGVFRSSAEFIDWVRSLDPGQTEMAGLDTNVGRNQ